MIIKRYTKAKWVSDTEFLDHGMLIQDADYRGDYLVFEDIDNGSSERIDGCVLFHISGMKFTGRAPKWFFKFSDKNLV